MRNQLARALAHRRGALAMRDARALYNVMTLYNVMILILEVG